MKCYLYEQGTLEKKKVPYILNSNQIGLFEAEVCPSCEETFFSATGAHSTLLPLSLAKK